MPYKVFLSHATADGHIARAIHQFCDQIGGVDVYLCELDPQPGRLLADKIKQRMIESDAVIFLLTPHAVNSVYVNQEIGLAQGLNKPVVPLMQKGTNTAQLGTLEGIEWIYFDPEDQQAGFADVAAFLQRLSEAQHKRDAEKQRATALANADAQTGLFIALMGLVMVIFLAIATNEKKA